MTELLTAAQMRAIEAAAIASGDVTGLELMERAGQGVVEAIFAHWPELALGAGGEGGAAPVAGATPPEYFEKSEGLERRAVVLCGPGNNGGDGFVVARLMRAAGWDVDVLVYGDDAKLPPDARVNYQRWIGIGETLPLLSYEPDGSYDLVVDALFGAGLGRPLATDLAQWLGDFFSFTRRVAVDCPSGLCMDSGRPLLTQAYLESEEPLFPRADLTVTFEYPRIGHFLCEGEMCGRVVVKSILSADMPWRYAHVIYGEDGAAGGRIMPQKVVSRADMLAKHNVFNASLPRAWQLRKHRNHHKYTHGHALILSGPVGKGGAARLAARGALRIGAGVVTLGVPPAALIENAAQLNAVMLAKIKDVNALTAILADTRINALCVGPGFGIGAREKALLAAVLAAKRATVLDADALTMLASEPSLFAKLHETCVLTPHAGEFARLFPDIAERLDAPAIKGPAYSKVDATRDAAKRAGCVILFKGPDTVIAAPDGQCSINASVYDRAAPWLATAGSGDVLAGFISGLLARGFSPMQAAETGAWLHTECALSFGPGLIAEDLPEELPKVLSTLVADK